MGNFSSEKRRKHWKRETLTHPGGSGRGEVGSEERRLGSTGWISKEADRDKAV